MRQIGVIPNESEAQRFAAYLATLGVTAHAEPDGGGCAIWVRDENQLLRARAELDKFRENPGDTRYQGVEREAATLAREREREREKIRKNIIEMRGRWGRPNVRNHPLTMVLIGLSIVVALLSSFGENRQGLAMNTLLFAAFSHDLDMGDVDNRLVDIKQGEVWRVITPIFVHFGPVHLVFNMIMLYQLGGYLEHRIGSWRLALLVLLTGAVSMTVQALVPAEWQGTPYAGGMSGVLFGLVGFMWMKTVFDPGSGIFVPMSTVLILGVWMFLGIFGVLKSQFGIDVANWGHGIGLVVGILLGVAPLSWRKKGT